MFAPEDLVTIQLRAKRLDLLLAALRAYTEQLVDDIVVQIDAQDPHVEQQVLSAARPNGEELKTDV